MNAPDSNSHYVRLYSYVAGEAFALSEPDSALRESLGETLGQITKALGSFFHPAAARSLFVWNLHEASQHRDLLTAIDDPQEREWAAQAFVVFEKEVAPSLHQLPWQVIYNDANDYNILCDPLEKKVTGFIDFGDMTHGPRIGEVAVACAYAMLGTPDPLAACCDVLRGYLRSATLEASEIDCLFDLAALRLALSVGVSSWRSKAFPENDYLLVSRAPALRLLERLTRLNRDFAKAALRHTAGLDPIPGGRDLLRWLSARKGTFHSVLEEELTSYGGVVVHLSAGSPALEGGAAGFESYLEQQFAELDAGLGIGLYDEDRNVYQAEQFTSGFNPQDSRSVHLGIDLFLAAGTAVHAPLAGRVRSIKDNDLPLDYGPTVILEHETGEEGGVFWTLYGHLSRSCLRKLKAGQKVSQGEKIAEIGSAEVNGGWSPHLHFQIMLDLLGIEGDFPGAGEPKWMEVWRSIVPDPNLILGLPDELLADHGRAKKTALADRKRLIAPSFSLSYEDPLKIVRGQGAYLYDEVGRGYLDCVNNIAHVGHCHPEVVAAIAEQAARLNTNTRYLHDNLLDLAERLTSTLPDPLDTCFFVNSGSEANDLALRLAESYSGRRGVVVLEEAYHGHSHSLIEVSPYKAMGPGGAGLPDHVRAVPVPDPYRGPHKGDHSGPFYASYVQKALDSLSESGSPAALFMVESIAGCAGQILYPDRFLKEAFERARGAGALCLADEVQVGLGRVGSEWWAFQHQDVVPDIVTIGKPLGNGHPVAAVVTSRAIAEAFDKGMEYFNSFGGNPVSCAAALAVFEVIEKEGLRAKAQRVGAYLTEGFLEMNEQHELVGDVRGRGLFIGVELVKDRESLEPATAETNRLVEKMRRKGLLLSSEGPYHNVLKIKPPLCFGKHEAERLLGAFEEALEEL